MTTRVQYCAASDGDVVFRARDTAVRVGFVRRGGGGRRGSGKPRVAPGTELLLEIASRRTTPA